MGYIFTYTVHTYFDNYNYNNGEAITIPYCTMKYLLPRPMATNLKRNLNLQFLTSISKKGVQVCSISSTTSTTISSNHARIPDPSFVNTLNAPFDFDASCAVVYNEYITSTEEDLVANDIKNKMKRRRYEKGHWDAVINLYKEVEIADDSFQEEGDEKNNYSEGIPKLFNRIRQQLAEHHLTDYYDDQESIHWLPCHAIDLKKDGELNAHVDSVRFSGDLVAGLSLLSPSIMRLIPCDDNDDDDDNNKNSKNSTKDEEPYYVDMFLPPRSLYVLTGVGRYKYSHQLLPDGSIFHKTDTDIVVRRDHRLSVIFRDSKQPSS